MFLGQLQGIPGRLTANFQLSVGGQSSHLSSQNLPSKTQDRNNNMDLTEIVTNTTTSLIDYQTIVDLDQGLINQDHWIINIFEYGTWLMGKI